MQRPTRTIETPKGNKVEVYTFLTAGERNKLWRMLFEHVKVDIEKAGKDALVAEDMKANALLDAREKMLEMAVVGINGSKDRVFDQLNNLEPEEYDCILGELESLWNRVFQQAK